MTDDISVEAGSEADLPGIVAIYNHYVEHTHVTFDLDPVTVDGRREWLSNFRTAGPHRIVVAHAGDAVAGYATAGPWRPRPAYAPSIETSVYVAPEYVGRGIGGKLYEALFGALRGQDIHRAYAGIALPNPASVSLHEKFGFVRAGLFTEQGRKFSRWWDVAWYEKPL